MRNVLNEKNSSDPVLEILSYLTGKELAIVSRVSKHLLHLSNKPTLWRKLLEKENVNTINDPGLSIHPLDLKNICSCHGIIISDSRNEKEQKEGNKSIILK